MHQELAQKLVEDFPDLYRGRNKPPTDSLMCFGFECGDGWFQLIYDLSADIMKIADKSGITVPELIQVKEKFGGLRFYLDHSNEPFLERISQAEALSLKTCEVCGEAGRRRPNGWVRTLCDKHDAEHQ